MNFKELRESKNIKQMMLAERLGVKQGTISMWETGRSIPKTTDLPKIAKVLNVPVDQVLACFTGEAESGHKGEAV